MFYLIPKEDTSKLSYMMSKLLLIVHILFFEFHLHDWPHFFNVWTFTTGYFTVCWTKWLFWVDNVCFLVIQTQNDNLSVKIAFKKSINICLCPVQPVFSMFFTQRRFQVCRLQYNLGIKLADCNTTLKSSKHHLIVLRLTLTPFFNKIIFA